MSVPSASPLPPPVPGRDRNLDNVRKRFTKGGLKAGMALPLRAFRFLLARRGVKRFAILPMLATLVVYTLVILLALWLFSQWDWGVSGEPWQFWGGFVSWLHRLVDGTLDVVKWIAAVPVLLAVCYFSFTAVGMIVGAPFNDLLSERVERSVCGEQARPQLSKGARLRSMVMTTGDAVKLVCKQIFFMILVLPFLLVPVVGFVPLLLVTAYFSGVGFVDIAMSRNGFNHALKKPVFKEKRWLILGLGLAMELLFLIPFAALLILPLGVTSGTLFYCYYNWDAYFEQRGRTAPPEFVHPRPLR